VNPVDPSKLLQVPVESLSEPLRVARAAVHESDAAYQRAADDLSAHEQGAVEQAKQERAQARAAAIREGRAEPKTNPVLAAEKRTTELEEDVRLAAELANAAREDWGRAVDKHGQALETDLREAIESRLSAFRDAVNATLIPLYGELVAALSVGRIVLGPQATVGAVSFPARAIGGLELASGQRNPHGAILTPDLLDRLSRLGEPEPQETGGGLGISDDVARQLKERAAGLSEHASDAAHRQAAQERAFVAAMGAKPVEQAPTHTGDLVTAISVEDLAASRRDRAETPHEYARRAEQGADEDD
jgi:hypothetical protein